MTTNKKGEILPIVLGAATACIIIIAAVFLCLDMLMRSFAPGIYMGVRLGNTYKQLSREKSETDSFFTGGLLPGSTMSVSVNGSLGGLSSELNGSFDNTSKKLYVTGSAGLGFIKPDIELFYDSGIAGICLPQYRDAWFCSEKKNILSDIQKSGISDITGIPSLPFSVPDNSGGNTAQLYSILHDSIKNIKIDGYSKKGNGIHEYRVYMRKEACQKLLSELAVYAADKYGSIFDSIAGSDSAAEYVREYFNELNFPENTAFTVSERDKQIVRVSADFTADGEKINIWLDVSNGARLSDNIDGGFLVSGGSCGFTYKTSGNRFFRKEKLSEDTQAEIILPVIGKTTLTKKVRFSDTKSFEYSVNAENPALFKAAVSGSGVHTDNELSLSDSSFELEYNKKSCTGSFGISFHGGAADFEIPERERYGIEENLFSALKR